jgi:hypothetical protein
MNDRYKKNHMASAPRTQEFNVKKRHGNAVPLQGEKCYDKTYKGFRSSNQFYVYVE